MKTWWIQQHKETHNVYWLDGLRSLDDQGPYRSEAAARNAAHRSDIVLSDESPCANGCNVAELGYHGYCEACGSFNDNLPSNRPLTAPEVIAMFAAQDCVRPVS